MGDRLRFSLGKNFFRKLWVFIFIVPIILTTPIAMYQNLYPLPDSPALMEPCANGYQVFDSENKLVGYVFGTMHSNFSELELDRWAAAFNTILPETQYLFLEAQLPHWSQLAMGIERRALQTAEHFGYTNQKITIIPMEQAASQYALVSSIKNMCGYGYYIPWGSLRNSHPAFVRNMNMWVDVAWLFPNIIYYQMINPQYAISQQSESAVKLSQWRENLLKGESAVTQNKEIAPLYIADRDRVMYQTVANTLKDMPLEENQVFLMCLGMFHLSTKDGMRAQFEAAGYTLKPYPIVAI